MSALRAWSVSRRENALRRLRSHPQDFGSNLPETDRRVILAQQALTKAIEDQRRLQERSERRAAARQAALRVLAAAETWLREGVPGNCRIEPIETEPPKLNKGESSLDGVERFRRRGREIKATIHTIQSSCFPKSYCKQRAHGMVEGVARAPDVSMLVELDRAIAWPDAAPDIGGDRRGAATCVRRSA
jgi:hypothetical protein